MLKFGDQDPVLDFIPFGSNPPFFSEISSLIIDCGMTIGTKIILFLILLHLIVGFGFIVKLMLPVKKGNDKKGEI